MKEELQTKKEIRKKKEKDGHSKNMKRFAVLLLIVEIVIIVMYGVFVRFKIPKTVPALTPLQIPHDQYYPMYQDVNVMMLIGFGFLMAFIKRHSWSALSYTFMINAVVVQMYILWNAFWVKSFETGFGDGRLNIQIEEKTFISASYCVASVLISFGGILGRVGPLQLLIMSIVHVIGYSLNEQIQYYALKVFDAGGSMSIHVYGAYFGLMTSFILCKIIKPTKKPETNYHSNTFAMIGTLFLWMYWPSFNAGYFPTTDYEKTQIISNTILSLTGSCLTTLVINALGKNKFSMEDILNATLVGGVIIGAPSGILYHAGGALAIGAIAGVISTLGFHYLTEKLQESKLKLFDTCGIHNLHGIPGVLGGILSAVAIAAYAQPGTIDSSVTNSTYLSIFTKMDNFYHQGGIQIAGTFISMGIGMIFAILAGFFMSLSYKFTSKDFFQDSVYFQQAEENNFAQISMNNKVMDTNEFA